MFIVFIVCTLIKGTQKYSQLLNVDSKIEFLIAPAYIISFTTFVFVLDIYSVYDRIFSFINKRYSKQEFIEKTYI